MEASIQGHGRAQARERHGNARGTLKPQAPCPNPLRSAGSGRLHTTGKTSTCMQHTEAAQPHPQRHAARSRSARCVAFACQHWDDCAAMTADAFGPPGYLSVAPKDVGARKPLSFLHFPAWPRQESTKTDSRWPGRYRCLEEGALGLHLEMQAGGCDCLAWLVRSVPHSLPRNLPTHDLSRPTFASPHLHLHPQLGFRPHHRGHSTAYPTSRRRIGRIVCRVSLAPRASQCTRHPRRPISTLPLLLDSTGTDIRRIWN
jgi:hypothetical protein